MDERLEKALEFSNFMVTLDNQKRVIQEVFNQNIVFYHNGCQFTVTKELLCFCNMLIDRHQNSVVLIDDNDIPIEIENLQKFLDDILDIYYSACNKFFADYAQIKNNRKIDKIVDL